MISVGCRRRRLVRAEEGAVAVVVLGAGVEQGGVLGADGERQAVLQRVEIDVIAQNVATHREQEGVAAAFEPLEQVGAAEADEALAGAGEVRHHLGLFLGGRGVGRGLEVIGEAVARQVKQADGVHYLVGIEPGVLVVRVALANAKGEGLGLALGKVETAAALEDEEAAVFFGLGPLALGAFVLGGRQDGGARGAFDEGVVAFDEAARAADHEEAHQFAPVVGMGAFFEGGEAIDGALMAAGKLVRAAVTVAADVFLGAYADDIVWIHEQTKLVGEVEVGFVVGGGGDEDAPAGIARDVIADGGPAPALAIAEVMAFVNDGDAVAAEVGQSVLRLGDGDDLGDEAVAVGVVFPHADEVLRAEDEGFERAGRVLKHAGQRGGHEGFAEADDIAEHDAAALFQMPGRDANRSGLKFEQGVAHVGRDGELGQPGASLFGQVIGHLDVDVIGRRAFGPRPAFVNDLDEFLGDVHAPLVAPAVVKPLLKFLGGVLVEDVHVEFALVGQAGEREIA